MRLIERHQDGPAPVSASPAETADTGNLLDEERHWRPKGDELVAKSNLVEIDELNPSGQGIRLASSPAAQGMAELVVSGQLDDGDSDVKVNLARYARDAVREDGVDIEKLRAELRAHRASSSG